jgi:ribosomal protein L4
MPSIKIYNMLGQETGTMELNEEIFGAEIHFNACVHEVSMMEAIREKINEMIRAKL